MWVHTDVPTLLSAFIPILVYVSGSERKSTKENEKEEAINFGRSSTLPFENKKIISTTFCWMTV